MIDVQNLQRCFVSGWGRRRHTVAAVQGMGWQAPDAAITGLLGPNGAGKTTCLRMVAGLIVPDSGQIRVDGIDVLAQPRRALARLGVLSDARGLYPRLTALENIVYHGRLQGLDGRLAEQRARELAELLELTPLLARRTEGFSQGERMKTALARALVHHPSHLILDEPTNGLDVVATRALRQALRRLRDERGTCIVVSTHIMQEVERLCDHVVVVAHGRTVATGSVAQLLAQTGETDFEEAFVQLAFGSTGIPADSGHGPVDGTRMWKVGP